MLSQKVTQRPGWNHEIAIGWRSKNKLLTQNEGDFYEWLKNPYYIIITINNQKNRKIAN